MKIEDHIRHVIQSGVQALREARIISDGSDLLVDVGRPKDSAHGDFSSNVALVLARNAGVTPRELATKLVDALPESDRIEKTEVAGPGFINFFVANTWLGDIVAEILDAREKFGRNDSGQGLKIQVEFVSANPTGPLHVGSGRNAAFGDSLCRILEASGYEVSREYLVNDAGRQIDIFTQSVQARYQEALGLPSQFPQDGYRGDYVTFLGRELANEHGTALPGDFMAIRRWALTRIIEGVERSLERFRVRFDDWFYESPMHESGQVMAAIERLRQMGHTFEHEGAVWFRGEAGARDQVLVKRDERGGDPTYFAHDIAYMLHKKARGLDRAIYIWGSDHHGDVQSLKTAAKYLGMEGFPEIILYQLVSWVQGGKEVRMAKRTGELVTLDELMDQVPVDAIRFMLVQRSTDQRIEFDFAVVKATNDENPVYRVQYSHARMCSILRYARDHGFDPEDTDANMKLAVHPSEAALAKKLAEFPSIVQRCAEERQVHPIANYALALASEFNKKFYKDCRVITDDRELSRARITLTQASRWVLANALDLIGVSAPEQM